MWLEEAETLSPNLCPQHDPTSALTLVATDRVWHEMPVNVTNLSDVLLGQPSQYRARPTWDMPAQHAANAAAAVVSVYKQELSRYTEYTLAEASWQRPYWLVSETPMPSSSKRPTRPSKPTLSLRAR
jgi:hypothetical protein